MGPILNRHLPAKTLMLSMLAASIKELRLGKDQPAEPPVVTPPRLPMHHVHNQMRRKRKNKATTSVHRTSDKDIDVNVCLGSSKNSRKPPRTAKIKRRLADPYHFVPGTFDLLSQRGIVCAGQTLDNVLLDNLSYTTPQAWNMHTSTSNKQSADTSPPGLVVFKRGGSGSTWFDSILGSHPDVSFQHEAQVFFRPDDTPEVKTDVLVDYLTTPKFNTRYRGFSISPAKHGDDVDWVDLFHRTGAVLVVFMRTNVVKRRVGMIRKGLVKQLPARCRGSGGGGHLKVRSVPLDGANNDRGNDNHDECNLDGTKSELSAEDIERFDYSCLLQTWDLLEVALSAGVPFQIVTFEGMEQSISDTMRDVGLFTGWDEDVSHDWEEMDKKEGQATRTGAKTTKVTPEDLSKVISNYAQVEDVLKVRDMDCYRDMLRAKTEDVFQLCHVPGFFAE